MTQTTSSYLVQPNRLVAVRFSVFELGPEEELYENPGPIQFGGSCANLTTEALALSGAEYFETLASVKRLLKDIEDRCHPGCNTKRARVAGSSLENLRLILD